MIAVDEFPSAPQSTIWSLISSNLAQFLALYVDLPTMIVSLVENLRIIVNKTSSFSNNFGIKSIQMIWNDMRKHVMSINFSYELCRFVCVNWHEIIFENFVFELRRHYGQGILKNIDWVWSILHRRVVWGSIWNVWSSSNMKHDQYQFFCRENESAQL